MYFMFPQESDKSPRYALTHVRSDCLPKKVAHCVSQYAFEVINPISAKGVQRSMHYVEKMPWALSSAEAITYPIIR